MRTRPDKQMCLCSASMSGAASQVCREWASDPVDTMALELALADSSSLTLSRLVAQTVHVCAEHKKPRKLLKHLRALGLLDPGQRPRAPEPLVVFCTKIKTVRFVLDLLVRAQVRAVALTGQMAQPDRERALAEFRAGKFDVLVATDVAGRGLHVKRLKHVVNYDFPPSLAQFAHRVGRAGRDSDGGSALSFFTRNLRKLAPDLVRMLEAAGHKPDHHLKRLAEEVELGDGSAEDNGSEEAQQQEALPPRPEEGSDEAVDANSAAAPIDDHSDAASSASSSPTNTDTDVFGTMPLSRFDPARSKGATGKPQAKRKRPRGKRGGKKNKG